MIKRIRFACQRKSAGDFTDAWRQAVAAATEAPPDVRPSRVTVCTTLADLTGPDARHDGISIEWFTDTTHLRRFEDWLDGTGGRAVRRHIDGLIDPAASPVLVADEAVMRGGAWLERRWLEGGGKYKHMALARRAEGLTPAQFSERWRNHAGTAGGTVIPDNARGRAYVQNHPYPRATGAWAYDAVNEVYFDDVDSLRTRIDWFRENLPEPADGALVGRSWFIAVHEEVVPS